MSIMFIGTLIFPLVIESYNFVYIADFKGAIPPDFSITDFEKPKDMCNKAFFAKRWVSGIFFIEDF